MRTRAAHRPPTLEENQRKVDQFNFAMPPGTPVILFTDGGEAMRTRVQSAAAILGGHSPVVWLEHAPGCFHVDRVRKDTVTIAAAGGVE